jgi:protein required for attachment to host cells
MKASIAAGDWVVVCDGGKALILENAGDEKFPNLKTKEVHEPREVGVNPRAAEPLATAQQSGSLRTGSPGDLQDESERLFLREIAARLDRAVSQGETKGISLVVAPRALGMIRAELTPRVQAIIKSEVGKDYVRMPVHEIEKHLTA